jgi:hypothetical protein
MSENSQQHKPLQERPPAAATTGDLEWESLEDEPPPAGLPSPGERTVIHLPEKRRAWKRRRVAAATNEPVPAGRRDDTSWRTAGVAVTLAACVGGAIALAITVQREHLRSVEMQTSIKRLAVPGRPHNQGKHEHRPVRRAQLATVKLTPIRARSDSGVPVLPRPPASSPAVSTTPPPTPVRQADPEGQIPGGPFSP